MSKSPNTDRSRWRLSDSSRREIRVTALQFLYNFLVMCAFSGVKPVRNAMLLYRLGIGLADRTSVQAEAGL